MSVWNYVATALKPSCVSHSCVGNFTSPKELNLIVAKCTRIEIHLVTPQGLQTMLDVPLYGRVAILELFRPPGETQDHLFILTDRYKFCVLGWDPEPPQLITRSMGDVSDRVGRPTDCGQIGIIDPECRLIGLHLYYGLFKVLPIDNNLQLKEPSFNIRLEELQVIDIKFLYGCSKPTIAVLYQDNEDARHIKTYEVSLKDKDFVKGPWSRTNLDYGADRLIPVPSPLCGALIIGQETIVYCSADTLETIAIGCSITKAYERVDVEGSRYLLGDYAGQIHLLVMTHQEEKVTGLELKRLGETSIASTISCLDNAVVFVGSSYGDSQLIKLNLLLDSEGSAVEVVEKYANLGPIVDFCVVNLGGEQSSVVTCSGAYKDGSLCKISNAIEINKQASVQLLGICGMWSLKSSVDEAFHRFLVISRINETLILAVNENAELGETKIEGFLSDVQTLFCHDAVGNQLVQITSSSVRLVSSTSGQLKCQWDAPDGLVVNVATANARQVLLATRGGRVFYLEIGDGILERIQKTRLDYEVSCLNINPIGDDPNYSQLAAVGTWTDISVRILALPGLTLITKEQLEEKTIPRSVLLCAFEGISYLLCALGDGQLLNFQIDNISGELKNRKTRSLGTQPSTLRTFSLQSGTHVFAASDRPALIDCNDKMLLFIQVNLKEVSHFCPFNTADFPDSLAIAREGELTVGTIKDIQKRTIHAIPLEGHACCICHQEQTRTFAICSLRNQPSAGESEMHNVRLLDDTTFDFLSTYRLDPFEYGCSILTCSFTDDKRFYYCVGTAYVYPDENEPHKGRILVFSAEKGSLKLIAEKATKGAVYSLSGFNGKLVAAINQNIELYKWMLPGELQWECGHHGHIQALYVQTRGNFIVVGDLMNSVSLLIYEHEKGAIEERARDDEARWMAALEILDDDTYLGADNCFNLFTLRKKNGDTATDEERSPLEAVGEYHIGDCVNRFRHGTLCRSVPDSEIGQIPTIIFGTVNGAIGVIASLPQEQYIFLEKLQTILRKVIEGVGGLSHEQWRSSSKEMRTTVEARSFLDGDLIESFLDLRRSKMEEISKGMDVHVEELCKRVVELTRLH